MRDNFFINVDSDGDMPVLTHKKPCKKHYTQYVNNKPVLVVAYNGQDRVWDYNASQMLSLVDGLQTWDNKPMPRYTGKLIKGA